MTPERRAELREMLVSLIQPGPNPDSGVDALHWCIEGRRKIACEALAVMDHLDARERRLREALEIALDMIHKLNGTFVPGNDAAGTEAADTCREIAAVLRKHAALSEVAPDA